MPKFQCSPDVQLHYEVDDFTDPWRRPDPILMLHGNAESGVGVVRLGPGARPQISGGAARICAALAPSTPMPRDFPWTLDIIIDDFVRLMDSLGIDRFHLVGAKIGGTIARAFAARKPERVKTLTVIGTPPPLRAGAAERVPELNAAFERDGVEAWARQTMGGRLGSAFPAEGVEWWIKFMGRTAVSTQIGFMKTIACADIRADLPKIRCPTLVITTDGSGLASVDETRAWQQQIANSSLVVVPGNSYHVAATHAEPGAAATLDFLAANAAA